MAGLQYNEHKELVIFCSEENDWYIQKHEDPIDWKEVWRSVGEGVCAGDWFEIPKHEMQLGKQSTSTVFWWVTWLNLAYLLLNLAMWRDAVVNSDDKNMEKIYPDKLRNRLDDYILSSNKAIVYEFFARYVRKVYSDSDMKTDLKNYEGLSFIDKITPSDIAFVMSVLKNGHEVWDQNIKMMQLGAAEHGDREATKWPLFTGGKGKKKEQGKSLWSGEGLKYFKRAE